MVMSQKPIFVDKDELPRPLVVQDHHGNYEVLELAPSGRKKLGARVSHASEEVKQLVRRFMKR